MLTLLPWCPLKAQWTELTVGSEASQYLYALQLRGAWGGESSAMRPFSPSVVRRWRRDSTPPHAWQARFSAAPRRLEVLRPSALVTYAGGDLPWSNNDGAVWQGLGLTNVVSAGVAWSAGRWSVRLEPVFFRTQNAGFALQGDTTLGVNAFVDPPRSCCIDLPQRFGRTAYSRLDFGQSEARVEFGRFTAGLSTMNISWGPGLRHSLLFTGNAPGVPHLFLGSADAWRTRVGRLTGRLYYGRASSSGWEPLAAGPHRLVTGVLASWQPPSGRGFEVGAARLYNRYWPSNAASLQTLTAPFGSFFSDQETFAGGPADNQLISTYARWRSETHGLEVYAEFGRNDRSLDVRDVVVEPEQNSAWLIGFARTLRGPTPSFWLLRGDVVNGRVGSISRLNRGQALFYEHSSVTAGHTQRGQLLGSSLLERSGGLELALDRFSPRGRIGGVLTSRAMPESRLEGQLQGATRTQWALESSAARFVGQMEVTVRGGYVLDINRVAGQDGSAGYLSVGSRWKF